MGAEPRDLMRDMTEGQLSRREFIKRAAALGFSASAIAGFLAACGASATATAVSGPVNATVGAAATSVPAGAASTAGTAATAVATNVPGGAAATVGAAATAVATNVPGGIGATVAAAATNPAGAATAVTGAAGGATKQVKLGVVLSLTGDSQIYGNPQRNAIQLAIDEVNTGGVVPGIQIQPVIEDDAGKKDQGITAFEKLIRGDQVIAIIGPTLSNTALSTNPVAQEAGVPVLGVSNTAGGIVEIGNFIFRNSLSEAQVIPTTVRTAKEKLNLRKVAILYDNGNAFTKSGFDVFKAALDANSVQIASTQTYATGDTDFNAQLTQIKGTSPDAIIFSSLAEGAQIAIQARQLGITVPIIGGNGLNSPAYIRNSAQAGEGTIVGAAWNVSNDISENTKFIQAYRAKYNSDPDQFAAQAYAGVYIMANAMKSAGANVDRRSLRDGLAGVKGLPTVLGTFAFKENRDADHPPVVQIVRGGKFEVYK